MRLNAQYMTDPYRYKIRDYNGNDILFCTIVDTDEGYAECVMSVPTKFKKNRTLMYRPLFSDGEIHTYTLHSFELWDIKTNILIARI